MEQALQDKLMQYLDAIERGVVEVAPKAYQMAVEVNYLSALISVITSVAILVPLWALTASIFNIPAKAYKEDKKNNNEQWFDHEEYALAYMGGGVLGVFAGIGTLATLSNTSMWITLVNKDLGLVYTIWQKFVG